MDYEAAVIGAGPGGLVSSLYLRRFLRRTILVSGGPPRASWIPKTHNVLGYRGGISGVQLLKRLHEQLDEVGIERAVGQFKVDRLARGSGFRVHSENGLEFTAKKVVLATGMTDIDPTISGLSLLRRRGLLRYCPVCDAFEYQNKKVAVLAQDDHGLKTARFLSRFTRSIDVLWPPSQKLPDALVRKCLADGIRVQAQDVVDIEEPKGAKSGLRLLLKDANGRQKSMNVDACYVALGIVVNDYAFRHIKGIKRNEDGYLIPGSHQELDVPGLFAVGDCVEGLAQIAVAAGHAAIAATRIHNQLRDQ